MLEQEIKHELASGWFQGASQGLFAYAQEACFIVLSTSTPTEAILALGPVTFQQLLANMEHVSVSILGENQKQVDRRFVLIRHKHADPLKEDYMCEHYMPCLPAEGIHHSFDTCASEWAAYLQQLKVGLHTRLLFSCIPGTTFLCHWAAQISEACQSFGQRTRRSFP